VIDLTPTLAVFQLYPGVNKFLSYNNNYSTNKIIRNKTYLSIKQTGYTLYVQIKQTGYTLYVQIKETLKG